MPTRQSEYLIVTSLPGAAPRRPTRPRRWWRTTGGRHRLGTPGTTPRCHRAPARHDRAGRGRHHRPAPRWGERLNQLAHTARYAVVLVLAGSFAASAWYSVAGATAFAQIIHP
ncbi:hypothetical protein JQS43_14910 [Natronosporangium hydrolyticum]|uniref:Uncharacterized protein n=1 Tax=Natronosporangium hydrolyticum TaxID=2811111 RepID=A0A895Y9G3_9ACTN|nr:hypothetical protein [Natronosporangium hydrolyticum]QSB12955.1 hypothetical protein JQS43_14910 [Natronosporangium hydrolyticum]